MLLLLAAYLANCDSIVYQVNCTACGSQYCFNVTGGVFNTLNFATTTTSCSSFNYQLSQITNMNTVAPATITVTCGGGCSGFGYQVSSPTTNTLFTTCASQSPTVGKNLLQLLNNLYQIGTSSSNIFSWECETINVGLIAGLVVGLVALCVIIGVSCYCWRRSKRNKANFSGNNMGLPLQPW